MAKIGMFYGSTTGNTETAADLIKKEFDKIDADILEVFNVAGDRVSKMMDFDYLILGSSSWGDGELQDDWDDVWDQMDDLDLSGKKVALFGLGDQFGFSDTFQDALKVLADKVKELGGELVGLWPNEGYEFDDSAALVGEKFLGLSLDEDNQSDLTPERVEAWVAQLKDEFEL